MTQIAVATLKSFKSSTAKVERVAKSIRNIKVSKAISCLDFSRLKVSKQIKELLYSAMANAENNHNMDVDNLFVREVRVGRAFALKRFSARGRGKSSKILKTYSNISVIIEERSFDSVGKNKLSK